MSKKLHPSIIKTKLELEKLDKNNQVTWGERRTYDGINLPISVEPRLRSRALNFMNEFLSILEKNNHFITIAYKKSHIEMYGQLTKFILRQKFYRKRVQEKGYSFSHNIFIKSDDLEFKILEYPRKIWIDKKTKNLESCIVEIYEYIEKRSSEWSEYRKLQKIKEDGREKEILLEKENARIVEIEKEKVKALIKSSQDYKLAKDIRVYLKKYDLLMKKENKNDNKHQEYIDWGYQKADAIDPLLNLEKK